VPELATINQFGSVVRAGHIGHVVRIPGGAPRNRTALCRSTMTVSVAASGAFRDRIRDVLRPHVEAAKADGELREQLDPDAVADWLVPCASLPRGCCWREVVHGGIPGDRLGNPTAHAASSAAACCSTRSSSAR
jgi:hypothetical protein